MCEVGGYLAKLENQYGIISKKQPLFEKSWWDRKGENEIDLVCENEAAETLSFFEVKTDVRRLNLDVLRHKAEAFFAKNPEKRRLEATFGGLSLDM